MCRIAACGSLPRMFGVEAQVGIGMKDGRSGKPAVRKSDEARPSDPVLLTATPKLFIRVAFACRKAWKPIPRGNLTSSFLQSGLPSHSRRWFDENVKVEIPEQMAEHLRHFCSLAFSTICCNFHLPARASSSVRERSEVTHS